MIRYFYSKDGTDVQGPIDLEDIHRMLDADILYPTSQICEEGSDVWLPLCEDASDSYPINQKPSPHLQVQYVQSKPYIQSHPSNSGFLIVLGCLLLLCGLSGSGYMYWNANDQYERSWEKKKDAMDESSRTMRSMISSIGSSNFRSSMNDANKQSDYEARITEEYSSSGDDLKRAKTLSIGIAVISVICSILCFGFAAHGES